MLHTRPIRTNVHFGRCNGTWHVLQRWKADAPLSSSKLKYRSGRLPPTATDHQIPFSLSLFHRRYYYFSCIMATCSRRGEEGGSRWHLSAQCLVFAEMTCTVNRPMNGPRMHLSARHASEPERPFGRDGHSLSQSDGETRADEERERAKLIEFSQIQLLDWMERKERAGPAQPDPMTLSER